MEKRKANRQGKDIFLLGKDVDGQNYYLVAAQWDCGWYWGGGYVQTYTNNKNPETARDIDSHSHFNYMFSKTNKNWRDAFKEFFTETPFTDGEIWKICELMKSFYIARDYSNMLHIGGAHYTSNPAKVKIQNETEYKRINNKVIPAIMQELYKILTPTNE